MEQDLKKKKVYADQSYRDGLKEYDKQMEQLHNEKLDIENELQEIVKELKDKLSHFKNVDEERKREQNLDEQWKERLATKKLEQEKKDAAVKHLQMAFRDFITSKSINFI